MKYIKTIETLIERANRKGVAKINRRSNYFGVTLERSELQETYRVVNNGNLIALYHYGTKTCEIDLNANKITYIYGESVSDVDSINTFLTFHNIDLCMGYKPVNGGFYVENYFMDDYTPETLAELL